MDARVRGNAHQLLEKYRNMARDATLSGDRITAEYYFQYADHYYRVLNENRPRFEESRQRPRDDWRDRDDRDDDGDEEGDDRAAASPRADRQERPVRQDAFDRPERAERQEPSDRRERFERGDRSARFDRDAPDRDDSRRDGRGGPRPVRDEALDADPDEQGGMISLAALPPPISRPDDSGRGAARDEDDQDAGRVRRTRRTAQAGPAEGPAASPGDAPAAPKRRGRPPKPRPESAEAELEEA